MLVIDHAFGRHLKGLVGHLEDRVRLRNVPAVEKLSRFGQILRIALGTASVDPLRNLRLFFLSQPGLVLEMADVRISKPRRHAPLVDHLANRFAPAQRFVIAGERKGPDLARAVTFDAAILKDPRDMLRIGDVTRRRFWHAANMTTHGFELRLAHRLAGQQLVDGHGQVAPRIFGFLQARTQLSVDAAPVAHLAFGVEHEDFRSANRLKLVGHDIAGVVENRKRKIVFACIRGDLRGCILHVRIDAHEPHAPVGVLGRQLRQSRSI